jgi:hypothetical protein
VDDTRFGASDVTMSKGKTAAEFRRNTNVFQDGDRRPGSGREAHRPPAEESGQR